MKTPYLAVAAVYLAPPGRVAAQTMVTIGSCDDWPSTITTDTILTLSVPEVACLINTHVEITGGAAVEITSMEASTKLNNVKFLVDDGSFLCTVPQLDWTSVETNLATSIVQVAGGAAMRIEPGGTATFAEDVTFSECDLPDENLGGGNDGSAIANLGTLVFQGITTFRDTIDGGALYSWGDLTFESDVIFENNKNNRGGRGNGSGGGLSAELDGSVSFKGAAYFIDNEITEGESSGGNGAALYLRTGDPVVFSGPVVVRGNSGWHGALYLSGSVVFESLVTLEDNVMAPKLDDTDSSSGGGIWVSSGATVEFQGGLVATGNTAKNGGALYVGREAEVTFSGPITIKGNEGRSAGGAIWTGAAKLTLPADADISDNTATFCPGIYYLDGEVEFEGGESYSSSTRELCYLGASSSASNPEDIVEEFDCEAYSASAPMLEGHPYLVLDTQLVKTWDLGTYGGFSCSTQLIVYVTGGQELTVTSTEATMSNVRFEVVGFTKLVLDVPNLTMTGIDQSQLGGALFVDAGSTMDVMGDIAFVGNTLAHEPRANAWVSRGGAAVYSAGITAFYGKADFLGNGQYEKIVPGEQPINEDGGAVLNSGTMTFMQKATFADNFNANGGRGGAVANFGDLTFSFRGIFRNNSVDVRYNDDGQPTYGLGGAVYNGGDDSTILFRRYVLFKDNIAGLGGGAVASQGYIASDYDDDASEGDSMVTFAFKAKFKDNSLRGPTPFSTSDHSVDESIGGGAVMAIGATSINFENTAVFKRNQAVKGGAVLNSASVSFVSAAKLFTADNIAVAMCPDILNNDDGVILIGMETTTGPSADLCERL